MFPELWNNASYACQHNSPNCGKNIPEDSGPATSAPDYSASPYIRTEGPAE